jgi:hypothetical protein
VPFYISDGGGSGVKVLPPLIAADGSMRPDMNREWYGKIVAIRSNTTEAPGQTGNAIQYDEKNVLWNTIAEPHLNTGQDISKFYVLNKEFNVIITGSSAMLGDFINKYGSVYNYMKLTDFGTRFKNSINFGIFNKTGKILYQVDDTSSCDGGPNDCGDGYGSSDIIPIPFGDNITVPLFDSQRRNNLYNINESRPFVRVFRYEIVNVHDETTLNGVMREKIYYWTPDFLTDEGFMYIPQFHACLFESLEAAQQFIDRYQTVQSYEKEQWQKYHYTALENKCDEVEARLNREHKMITTGCAVLLSLQLAWKFGEVFVWLVKNNVKTRKSSKNRDIPGKQSFMNSPFNSGGGIFGGLISTFL